MSNNPLLPSYHPINLPNTLYSSICELTSQLLELPKERVAILEASTSSDLSAGRLTESMVRLEPYIKYHLSAKPKEPLVISNILTDERTKELFDELTPDFPVFIAITPLVDSLGAQMGLIFIWDRQERNLTSKQLKSLQTLANHTLTLISGLQNTLTKVKPSTENKSNSNSGVSTHKQKLGLSPKRTLKKSNDHAKKGYWSINLSTFFISWSDTMYAIWGRNKKSFKLNYEDILATVHPEDRDKFIKKSGESFYGQGIHDISYRIILPDGTVKWVHELGHLVVNQNGATNIFEGTIEDITEQKKEERQLKLLQSVVVNTKEAVLVTEAHPLEEGGQKIVFVNQAFVAMSGYAVQEVLGKSTSILLSPNADPNKLRKRREAMQQWQAFETTLTSRNKNGEDYWVHCVVNPVADANGNYTHWVSIERDVTEKKNLELQEKILNEISVLLNSHQLLETCLEKILQHLIKRINFSVGQFWIPNSDRSTMTLAAQVLKDPKDTPLLMSKETYTPLGLGEGLPGTVWQTNRTLVWDSVEKEIDMERATDLHPSSKKAFTGIPLIHNDKVKGILVLGVENTTKSPLFYGKLFKQLQANLGAAVKRKILDLELDQIFNFTPDILCKIGDDGMFKKINPTATKLLGFSEQEILSKKIIEFVHPEDREETVEQLIGLYQGKPLRYFENRYLTKEGKIKWLSWTADLTHEKGITYAVAKDITQKKEIEGLLKDVTKLARIGAWELNLENDTLFWSEMTKEIHEVDKDFVPSLQNIVGFYEGQENAKKFIEIIKSKFLENKTVDLEFPIRTAKGKEKWIRAIGKPEFFNDKCIRIYGSYQDIHQLKSAEQEFIKASKEKKMILESIGDAFISLTTNGIVTYWNQKAEESFGIDRKQILGKHYQNVFTNERDQEIFTKIFTSIKLKDLLSFERYFPNSKTWYEINAYPSDYGVSIYFKDVNARIEAEKEIELTNERFKRVAQSTNDAIWDWDITNNSLFLSEAFKTHFGHNVSNASQNLQLWENLLHPSDKTRVLNSYYKAIDNPEELFWEEEYRLLKANGEYAYIWDKAAVIRDGQAKAIRMIGALTDISLLKTHEEALKQLNRELQERALNIEAQNEKLRDIAWTQSHVVRAPLARLMGLVYLLKDDIVPEEEKMEFLSNILSSAVELDGIIREIVAKSQAVIPETND